MAKPIRDKYSGPFRVLERGNKAWKVQVGERVEIISKDHLKPHLGSVAPKATVPPKHGRPRNASVASVILLLRQRSQGGLCNEQVLS